MDKSPAALDVQRWRDGGTQPRHGVDGRLVTRARSRVPWARITPRGRVHRVQYVIVRWNFNGGTPDRPDVTFVLACGPQRRAILPAAIHDAAGDRCARCDNVLASGRWPHDT
jgi:hypothetical protein